MADDDALIIPYYPEWIHDGRDFVTLLDNNIVRVRLEQTSLRQMRYVARVEERELLVEPFEIAEDEVGNIRKAWERISKALPEAIMEHML